MRAIVLILLLAGCSSAGLQFSGVAPVRVVVDGSTFDVYARDGDVQAIRLSHELFPNKADTLARAIAAIEQATGCQVLANSLAGDTALVKAKIRCSQT